MDDFDLTLVSGFFGGLTTAILNWYIYKGAIKLKPLAKKRLVITFGSAGVLASGVGYGLLKDILDSPYIIGFLSGGLGSIVLLIAGVFT